MLWLGMRNSGKGTIIEILIHCFGKRYIHNCESGNLFPKDTSGDAAKLLSWIIAMQFARLGYFNEIPTERGGRAIKCDGTFIKKLASGGDGHTARTNHKDEQDVTIDFTMAVLCNERPDFAPDDCLQNCQSFLFKGEFKEQKEIEKEQCEHRRKRLKLADPEIKTGYCADPETVAAFTYLLFDHYLPHKPVLDNEQVREDMQEVVTTDGSISEIVNKWFVFDGGHFMKDCEIKKPKEGSYDRDDATAGDRGLMWEELKAIGVTKPKTLKQHVMTQLVGVTEDGLSKEDRKCVGGCTTRGMLGVRFVTSESHHGAPSESVMDIDFSSG